MPRSRARRRPEPPRPESAPVLHAHLTVVETDDPLLLQELKADPRLGPLLLAQLSDRVAVVLPAGTDALVKQMLKAGHLPKVSES